MTNNNHNSTEQLRMVHSLKCGRTHVMRTLMACVTFAILLTASAQNISGTWQGQLDLGMARLNIVVNIASDGTCTIDSPDQGARGIPAKVVSNTLDKADNLMTIDRGRVDGVERDMGVACGNGVVGVVYLVSDHYAAVIPVLNVTSSRISCAIRGRGYFGYLQWYGGDASVAYVEDIPRHARFKRGDWVETSGYSAIFPPGVLVGKIENIYNSADGLSYRLKVRLTTDFGCLRDVVVISDKSIGERLRLQEQVKDSITMAPR